MQLWAGEPERPDVARLWVVRLFRQWFIFSANPPEVIHWTNEN